MSHRVLIIHPHPVTPDRIAKLLAPVEVDVRCAGDFRAAVEMHFEEPAHLVITPDIDVPEQKHGVVSGVRKASARRATIVLVPEIPEEGACPKAARLLTGPQMYLPWPCWRRLAVSAGTPSTFAVKSIDRTTAGRSSGWARPASRASALICGHCAFPVGQASAVC